MEYYVWQHLVNLITLFKLSISCNFIGMFSTSKSQMNLTLNDLCATFLNFQTSSWSSFFVNAITPHELHTSCSVNFVETNKSDNQSVKLQYTCTVTFACYNMMWYYTHVTL